MTHDDKFSGVTFKSFLKNHSNFQTKSQRRDEVPVDQDWPSIWSTATASFPPQPDVRRESEKRPPFKNYGNLELLKAQNFSHLAPKHIQQKRIATLKSKSVTMLICDF
jgi:hypothetical protein